MGYLGARVEGRHTADFILTEANGLMSRDNITIAQSGKLEPGTVLGTVTASGEHIALDEDASDGSQVATAVLYAAVDATDAEVPGIGMARDCSLIADQIIWPDAISAGDKKTAIGQLTDQHVLVR